MSKTVVITSGKGGTGKSTITALLGRRLAGLSKNVLLLELDAGLRGLDLMLGVSDRVVYDLADLLLGRCKPIKAIVTVESERGNLHLVAAPVDRWFVPDVRSLSTFIQRISMCYDYVLIDTAAGLGNVFEAAVQVCDLALIVVNVDPVSVRDGAKAVELLEGHPTRLVINRFTRRQLGAELPHLDRVIDLVGSQLISVIPEDAAVARAIGCGSLPLEQSPAWREMEDLARRLTGEQLRLDTGRLK